jgi:hypothetical protein
LNFASLDGTKNIFDVVRGVDNRIERIYAQEGSGIGGFLKLGDNALVTTASRTFIRDAKILMYGPAEGKTFDVQNSNGNRISFVTISAGTASVSGAMRGIHIHPTGGDTTCDSGVWTALEFNFPNGKNINTVLDIDASQGIIVNQWFTDCIFDHTMESAIKIHVDAGAHASARTNNIFFTNTRSTPDGGGAVLIDNTGQRDITNLSFSGGTLTGWDLAAVRMVGTTDQIDVAFIGISFTDEEVTTVKSVIDAQGCAALRVVGNSAAARLTTQTCKFNYLVNFLADVPQFVITDNDCRRCSFGVIESTNLGLSNADKNIVANNNGPRVNYTKRISTTDATITTIANIALLDAGVYHIGWAVSGVKSDGTDRASYELLGTFYRTAAGNATQQGATTVIHSIESNAAWAAAFAVTGSTVQMRVTGVAATNIKWGATLTKFLALKE